MNHQLGSLDPENLTPIASLNRLKIVDLPGVDIDLDVRGKTGYELLSTQALAELVHMYVSSNASLEGTQNVTSLSPTSLLNQYLDWKDVRVRTAAEIVGEQFGRRLGYLLAVLKRGDTINRDAYKNWNDSYWHYWSAIRTIRLAGGLVAGSLGVLILQNATTVLHEVGVVDYKLHLAPHPIILPLIGAARSVPQEYSAALVFDFGHSLIKRGYPIYRGQILEGMWLLSSVTARWMSKTEVGESADANQTRLLAEFIALRIADTWQEIRRQGLPLVRLALVSIACYLQSGQPLAREGDPYAQLHTVSNNLSRWLTEKVSSLIGQRIEILLIHDGTAAARAYNARTCTSVVMLGTALGAGFSPQSRQLRPSIQQLRISQDFSVAFTPNS